MLPRSRHLKMAKILLAPVVLLLLAGSLALALVQAENDDRVVEIVMEPWSAPLAPQEIAGGGTKDFLIYVLPHGRELTAVAVEIEFDPSLLEVVDADPNQSGVQILPHHDNPLNSFTIENEVDNSAGLIKYTVGDTLSVDFDFPLATVEFQAKGVVTGPNPPTEVVFLVDEADKTAATKAGINLLRETQDFIGAWIVIEDRPVDLVMIPETSREDPANISGGGEQVFTVQIRAGDADVTTASLAIAFDPEVLQVAGGGDDITGPLNGEQDVRISLHPDSPLRQFQVENAVNNDDGIILFTVGDTVPASGTFNFALIKFVANGQETPEGEPTEVVFEVDNGNKTFVGIGGHNLLFNTQSFVGAWVALEDQLPPASAQIDADDDGAEGVPVTFDGSGSQPGDGATSIVDYNWDFGDGSGPVDGPDSVVQHEYDDDGDYEVTLRVEDNNGGRSADTHFIDIQNVAPRIDFIVADPRTLPSEGGTSTITVDATDVHGDINDLLYSFDCNGNGEFDDSGDVEDQPGNQADCTFTGADIGINPVNVQVDDQDGGVTDASATVNVGVSHEDWTGTLSINGEVPNSGPLSGNPVLNFGIRPFCTDLFEFAQKNGGSGEACDVPRGKLLPATELQVFFDNPNGGDPVNDVLFDNTLLIVSRFGPPDLDGQVMKWPLRIDIDKPDSTVADVTIEWDIEPIPDEFITVLLIDHDTLPAFNVTNIGTSANGTYTIPGGIPLDAQGKAIRNLSIVVTRSLVQLMPLPKDFNLVALTLQPESALMGDIFKFSGAGSLSLVEDPGAAVFFIQTWDPRADLPIDQRAGTARTLFTHDSLVPGQGYMVFVVTLSGSPKDHLLIIPGAPLLDTSRGRWQN